MAKFFLIDHSLRSSGGHHLDYTRCIAKAAAEQNYDVVIGTHRDFSVSQSRNAESVGVPGNPPDGIDQFGLVQPVFRQTTYQRDSHLAGLQRMMRTNTAQTLLKDQKTTRWGRAWNRVKKNQHLRRREKFIRNFASDCERFFSSQTQSPGDHAFFTTVSELEILGLAQYLSTHPESEQTHWHLQFHFNLFDGRTPEYNAQRHIADSVRKSFIMALAELPYHWLHFYTTSDVLADQYSRLGVGHFESLAYPINDSFAPENTDAGLSQDTACSSRETEPLRITCPGQVRREKGHRNYLQPLVDAIWSTHLQTGKTKIVVQRPARKWPATKQKIELRAPETSLENSGIESAVEYFSHPLSKTDYTNLIKSTDIGLLFYDARVYFSRRAGVLGELLACGKPVIVPAGSWLADQIQEPVIGYLENIVETQASVRTIDSKYFQRNRRNLPMPGGVLSFDQGSHPFEFSVVRDRQEDFYVLQFDWHWPTEHGTYCRIDCVERDKNGSILGRANKIVGIRPNGGTVMAMFPIKPDTDELTFSLTNAYHDSAASIKGARVTGFANSFVDKYPPLGSVGIVASGQDDLPECVEEIVKHIDHYRESAQQFSHRWYAGHDPKRTVAQLASVDESFLRAA